ncbi:hypothetical protein BRC82_09280 [Halobacteriales archaeon QS_1_67_19]|nr:MAG: hypothetical protein BRC82_09280 [Halobacteriales archaeon QS_1_67_19]
MDAQRIDAEDPSNREATRSDLVHERVRESPFRRWVLLDGNRHLLAAGLSLAIFAACATLGSAGLIPVTDPDTATGFVGAVVGGTLPFITIVLAINQLVLSQELGWTGELSDRFEAMASFRRRVEEWTDAAVSPAAPADFLRLIVEAVVDRAERLGRAAAGVENPDRAARVEDFVEAVRSEGAIVAGALEEADFGTFDALSAVLGHFNGSHLHTARTLRAECGDDLPADTLDALVELLGYLAVARQTFKTLYVQHELAHLSKVLLYVGFPTLFGGGLFMMTYGRIISAVGDPTALVGVVSLVVTLVFLPFVVLLSYTLRIATIASRTADFGPFVPRAEFRE